MDKKLVERELLRQLQLIGFDRSKTLMEQVSNFPPISGSIFGVDPNIYGKKIKSTECPSGYEPLPQDEMEYLSKRIDNPLNSTLNNYYVKLKDGSYCRKMKTGIPDWENAMNELADVAHIALPVLGILVTILTGGAAGFIAGAAFELTDATIYYAQENYVAFWVGVVCAFLPWAKIIKFASFQRIGKKGLQTLIDKLARKGGSETLTDLEKQALKDLSSKEIQKELTYEIVKQSIKVILKRSTLGKLANLVWELVRGGFIVADFLKTPVVIVYGLIITFETILRMYGIIKDDTQLPKTPPISPYIPDDENLALILKPVFEKLVSDGKQYSVKNGTSFNLEVLLIQLFLKNSKSWSEMKSLIEIKNRKISITDNSIISKVQLFSTTGNLLGTLNCKGIKSKSVPFNWPYGELPPKQPMIIKVTDINGKTELIKTFYNAGIYGGKITTGLSIKWGYYDNATQKMVAAFQSQKGLTNDGIVGAGTLEKMSNLIKDSSYIPNNSGVKIKFEDVMKYAPNQQEIDKKIQEKNIKIEDVESEYEKVDKTKIQDSLVKNINTGFEEKLFKIFQDSLQEIDI